MGLTIDRERFDPADYLRFELRLEECLLALERLELCLVDAEGRALPRNQEVRAETAGPRVVLEIDRFNLELNLTPAPLAGRPFAAWPASSTRPWGSCAGPPPGTAAGWPVAGNSPTFLGHRLWQETRVALFKQAVDDRDAAGRSSRRVSRVKNYVSSILAKLEVARRAEAAAYLARHTTPPGS